MPLTAGAKLGIYEIVAPLGAGGMGEVYRAHDHRLNRDVAVKVLSAHLAADPAALARFEREAQAVAALSHPNILAIHDFGTAGAITYTVTELLEGQTLRERLADGALAPRKAIEYGVQIVRGIAAAHERGIIHRDLKPENVFLTRDSVIKILDFGLAKTADASPGGNALAETQLGADTAPGTVLGTVGYMSPEQVRGLAVDARTDIFSFGAVLYEMLAGRRAFRGDSHVETLNAILKEDPPELSAAGANLPVALDRIVRRCLEKQPAERFHSAHDLAIALEAVSGSSVASSGAMAAVPAAPKTRRRGLVGSLAALVIVGAAAFGAGRFLRPPGAGVPELKRLTYQTGPIGIGRFVPGGDTIVYSARFGDNGTLGIYSTHASTPDPQLLSFAGAAVASVSSKGELAVITDFHTVKNYARVGTLARAPLAGGAPRAVLENVQDADWLPDGSDLVTADYANERYRLEFPIGHVVYETAGWISHVRVSPDGTRVAFLDHPILGDDRGSAAVVDAAGHRTTISPMYESAQGLAWQPSGREVWFAGAAKGSSRAVEASTLDGHTRTLYRAPGTLTLEDVAADGQALISESNDRRGTIALAPGDSKEHDLSTLDWTLPAAISADGKMALLGEEGDGGGPGYAVYLRPTDGSPPVRLGPGAALALSPDAKWVISARLDPAPSQLLLIPTGAGESRALSNDAITHLEATFLPDGKNYLFVGFEPDKRPRSWVQPLAGGPARPVTPEGVVGWVTTPDGAAVAARDLGGQRMLFPLAGGAPTPVKFDPADSFLGFAPSGDLLVYRRLADGVVQISRANPTTGAHTPIRQITPRPGSLPMGGIGNLVVTPDGQGYLYSYAINDATLFLVRGLK